MTLLDVSNFSSVNNLANLPVTDSVNQASPTALLCVLGFSERFISVHLFIFT